MVKKVLLFLGSFILLLFSFDYLAITINYFINGVVIILPVLKLVIALVVMGLSIPALVMAAKSLNHETKCVPAGVLLVIAASFNLLFNQLLDGFILVMSNASYSAAIMDAGGSGEIASQLERTIIANTMSYIMSFTPATMMLVIAILSLALKSASKASNNSSSLIKNKPENGDASLERIKKLKEMFDSGVLSEEEYKELKMRELGF